MVSVPASVVTVGLTIAGDLASFGPAQEASLKTSLRKELSCEEPACFLSVRLRAGSINVETSLTIPQPAAAAAAPGAAPIATNPSATLAAVQAAANNLVTSPTATISSALGVAVTAADPAVSLQTDIVVPLAVAPPPPSPPPPPTHSSPPPSQGAPPTVTPSPSAASPAQLGTNRTSEAQSAEASTGLEPSAIWIGVALVLVVIAVSAGYCWWRRTQRKRGPATRTATATAVAFTSHRMEGKERLPEDAGSSSATRERSSAAGEMAADPAARVKNAAASWQVNAEAKDSQEVAEGVEGVDDLRDYETRV